jgi:hypothetical protein
MAVIITNDEKINAKRYVEENCKDLPTTRKIPHWSKLLDAKYCDMFLGIGQEKFGIPGGLGNYLTSSSEASKLRASQYTGNIFKTAKGTMIYFGSEEDPQYKIIIGRELLGTPQLIKGFCVGRGDHSWFNNIGWQQRFYDNMFKDSNIRGFKNGITDTSTGISFANFRQYLEQADNKDFPSGTVIKLTYSSRGMITTQSVAKDLGKFLSNPMVQGALVGALAVVGVDPVTANKIITTVAKICNAVGSGEPINYADLLQTAGPIMPQSMKPHMGKVGSLYAVYQNPTPETIKACADTLGVNAENVKKIIGGTQGNVNPSELLFTMKAGSKLEDANTMLSGLKSINLTEFGAKNGTDLTRYYEKIKDADNPLNNSLIQNLSTNTLGTQLNSLIPNIDVIAQSIIAEKLKSLKTPEEHRNLLNMATGQQDLDTVLPDMSMTSLMFQAINSAKNGKPYLLPAEIPDEFRKCTAMNIMAETGVPVMDKPPTPKEAPKLDPNYLSNLNKKSNNTNKLSSKRRKKEFR